MSASRRPGTDLRHPSRRRTARSRSGPGPGALGGFTLIELLVVIVIIGVLISIAIPSLRRARQAAHTTACLSNMHQLGIMVNAYLASSDGRLPALRNRADRAEPGPALDTLFAEAAGALVCPSDTGGIHELSGTSYFWNFTVNGQRIEQLFSIVGGRELSRIPLISDKEGFHPELVDKVNILYADGRAARELRFTTRLGDVVDDYSAPPPGPGGSGGGSP